MSNAMSYLKLICPACKTTVENTLNWFQNHQHCSHCSADLSSSLSEAASRNEERERRVRLASPFIF